MDKFVVRTKRETPTRKHLPDNNKELKQTTILSLKVGKVSVKISMVTVKLSVVTVKESVVTVKVIMVTVKVA